MKIITIVIFISAFLLLRPYHLQKSGLCYIGDDHSYFAHACSLAFGKYPSYENEFFISGGKTPKGSIGAGLLASPSVFLFSLIDRLTGSDIVYKRTPENIPKSWSLFGFVFATNLYFWIACSLLYKGLITFFKKNIAAWTIIIVVLFQGLPLFVFRRPIFSHTYEFFLQSLLFLILVKLINNNKSLNFNKYILYGLIGIISGLVFLVRLNNFLAAFLWPIILLSNKRFDAKRYCFLRAIIFTYLLFLISIITFKVFPDIYGYQGLLTRSLQAYPFSFYLKRFFHVLFGIDWGLIYTAPFIIIGLWVLFFYRVPLKKQLLLCLVPVIINFYTILVFKTQGGWYGYRYFIASIIPLLVLPIAFLIQQCGKNKKIFIMMAFLAIFPLLSMLSFEGNNSNLTLSIVETNGIPEWDNHTYQLEVWKTLLFRPIESFIAFLKGGPLYIIYILALIFNFTNRLPAVVLDKYPDFQLHVFIKTLILYLLPFLLYWIVEKKPFTRIRIKYQKNTDI